MSAPSTLPCIALMYPFGLMIRDFSIRLCLSHSQWNTTLTFLKSYEIPPHYLTCVANTVMNQNLVCLIEKYGGEVLTTPYGEYAKMITMPYFLK